MNAFCIKVSIRVKKLTFWKYTEVRLPVSLHKRSKVDICHFLNFWIPAFIMTPRKKKFWLSIVCGKGSGGSFRPELPRSIWENAVAASFLWGQHFLNLQTASILQNPSKSLIIIDIGEDGGTDVRLALWVAEYVSDQSTKCGAILLHMKIVDGHVEQKFHMTSKLAPHDKIVCHVE